MKHAGRNFMSGTFWVFVAEALIFSHGADNSGHF